MYRKIVLPNGVRVVAERIDHVRSAAIGIWVGNGSRFEPAELGGISHFIEHMIFKGTEKRTARHIASVMDAMGGQSNAFTTKDCTCYYMKVLDTHVRTAAELLADMFLCSKFADEDIALERGVVLEEIDMYEDTPEDVATEKLFEACYAGTALERPILGTETRCSAWTLTHCTPICGRTIGRKIRSLPFPDGSPRTTWTISVSCSSRCRAAGATRSSRPAISRAWSSAPRRSSRIICASASPACRCWTSAAMPIS